jgi:hypothetical protein
MTGRAFVIDGFLLDPGFEKDTPDGVVNITGFERPLTSLNGVEPPKFYRGPGALVGYEEATGSYARIVLGDPHKDANLYEFAVGAATQESIDRRMGELHAAEQKRMRSSPTKSHAWWQGWIEIWTERRKLREAK